jgi:hypothetical protein
MLPLLDLHAVHMSVFVLLAPLLAGIVKKTKAFMSTRRGAPVWQPYLDLWKLFRRPIVLSRTASRVFGLSTPIVLGTALVLAAATPLFSADAPLKLNFVLFIYLMALPRFFQILAGLDTGSAFGGLGSSREATVAAMAEPALLDLALPYLLARQDLEPGARYRVPVFDPRTLSNQTQLIEVIGPEAVSHLGRLVAATHLRRSSAGLQLDSWLDPDGRVLKEQLQGGLELVNEGEEQATSGITGINANQAESAGTDWLRVLAPGAWNWPEARTP